MWAASGPAVAPQRRPADRSPGGGRSARGPPTRAPRGTMKRRPSRKRPRRPPASPAPRRRPDAAVGTRRAAVAAAGVQLDALEARPGRGLFDPHARPVGLELLGQDHRQQRASPGPSPAWSPTASRCRRIPTRRCAFGSNAVWAAAGDENAERCRRSNASSRPAAAVVPRNRRRVGEATLSREARRRLTWCTPPPDVPPRAAGCRCRIGRCVRRSPCRCRPRWATPSRAAAPPFP